MRIVRFSNDFCFDTRKGEFKVSPPRWGYKPFDLPRDDLESVKHQIDRDAARRDEHPDRPENPRDTDVRPIAAS